jgi:Bacteriophage protein gp37
MGDLFGEYIPANRIRDILAVCEECKQHTFLFLTKNPRRYIEFIKFKEHANRIDFPSNCWVGTTVTNQKDADERIPFLLQAKTDIRFVSIEPILGQIDVNRFFPYSDYCPAHDYGDPGYPPKECAFCEHHPGIDWVIIGAMTGHSAVKPKPEWVESIIEQARSAGVPLFIKDNVKWPEKIQEFPRV